MTIKELYKTAVNKHCEDMELYMIYEPYTQCKYVTETKVVFREDYAIICKTTDNLWKILRMYLEFIRTVITL